MNGICIKVDGHLTMTGRSYLLKADGLKPLNILERPFFRHFYPLLESWNIFPGFLHVTFLYMLIHFQSFWPFSFTIPLWTVHFYLRPFFLAYDLRKVSSRNFIVKFCCRKFWKKFARRFTRAGQKMAALTAPNVNATVKREISTSNGLLRKDD